MLKEDHRSRSLVPRWLLCGRSRKEKQTSRDKQVTETSHHQDTPQLQTQRREGNRGVWQVFAKGELLGEGRYGQVWRCTDKRTGRDYACKELRHESKSLRERAEVEIEIMAELSAHPNIVGLHAVYRECSTTHIVMEFCSGGDLFDLISSSNHGLPELQAREIFRQVAQAVRHCHRSGVLHRDIKPENILLTEPKRMLDPSVDIPAVKLGDFGLATRISEEQRPPETGGSSPYSAPEVELNQKPSRAADVWSLGIVLCCMLTGDWPHFTEGGDVLPRGRTQWDGVSPVAEDLLRWMLEVLPENRPGIEDVLAHPWIVHDNGLLHLNRVCQQHCARNTLDVPVNGKAVLAWA